MTGNALLNTSVRSLARSRSFTAEVNKQAVYSTPNLSSTRPHFQSVDESIVIPEALITDKQDSDIQKASFCANFKRRYAENNFFRGKYKRKGCGLLLSSISKLFRLLGILWIIIAFLYFQEHHYQLRQNIIEITTSVSLLILSFALSTVFLLCFGLSELSKSVAGFWIGYTFARIYLTTTKLPLLNLTLRKYLITGTAFWLSSEILSRLLKSSKEKSVPLFWHEVFLTIGFGLGYAVAATEHCVAAVTMLSILAILAAHLHMKTKLAILLNCIFPLISVISVIRNMQLRANPYALLCFYLILLVPNVLDCIAFNNTPSNIIWDWYFTIPKCISGLMLSISFCYNTAFFFYAIQKFRKHSTFELPIMIPITVTSAAAFVTTWICNFSFQIIFIQKMHMSGKQKQAKESFKKFSIKQLLGSEGIVCLFGAGYKIKNALLFSAFVFGFICWQREDCFYAAFYMLVVALESFSLCCFQHLQRYMGGTSIGYVLVAPTTSNTNNPGDMILLSQESVAKQNNKVNNILSSLSTYFAGNLIHNFGCKYIVSNSALTVESHLREFFGQKCSADNRFYDNYILYFNGLVTEKGDLLLPGNTTMSPDRLLAQWRCRFSCSSHSKLILILDVPNASNWQSHVQNTKNHKIALQATRYTEATAESGFFFPSYYTSKWVQFNQGRITQKQVISELNDHGITSFYSLSLPLRKNPMFSCSEEDLNSVLNQMVLVPCNDIFTVSRVCGDFFINLITLEKLRSSFRRLQMSWFTPKVYTVTEYIRLFKS